MNDVLRQPPPVTPSPEKARLARARTLLGRPIGEILKAIAGLTEEKLEEALAAQAEKGGRLGEILVGIKAVSEEDVAKALAAQLDIVYLPKISAASVSPHLVKLVPINFAKQARILPLSLEADTVVLAAADRSRSCAASPATQCEPADRPRLDDRRRDQQRL